MMRLIETTWRELEQAPTGAAGWRARRIYPASPCALFAALEEPGGRPALLLEVASAALDHVVEYPAAAGFSIRPQPIVVGPKGQVRLCMLLTAETQRDLFGRLVDDVALAVAETHDDRGAVAAMLSRLYLWQRFLRHQGDALSIESQLGLLGELHALEQILIPALGAQRAVHAWVGPKDGLRDFDVFPGVQIEVKTTTEHHGRFRVANLDQLDDSALAHLLLCHVTMPFDPAGLSLPVVVGRLRSKLAAMDRAAAAEFEDLLLQAGYHDMHQERYAMVRTRIFKRLRIE